MRVKCVFFLLAVVFATGCVNTPALTSKSVSISMDANPDVVFSGGTTTVTMDIENKEAKALKSVNADIFETGMFDYADRACRKEFGDMEPGDFKTLVCNLKARKTEDATDNTIWARVKFSSTLFAVQTFDILSQSEHESRKRTGKADEGQKSFTFRDSNLELVMELGNAPLIDGTGKKEFVSFSIRNIGSGFIEKLDKSSIRITLKNAAIKCPQQDIYIIGREFPRFTCQIDLRGTVTGFITAELSSEITYSYETRISTSVRTLKGASSPPADTISGDIVIVPNGQKYKTGGVLIYKLKNPNNPLEGGGDLVKDIQVEWPIPLPTDKPQTMSYYKSGLTDERYIVIASVEPTNGKPIYSNHDRDCVFSPKTNFERDCVITTGTTQDFTITLPEPV